MKKTLGYRVSILFMIMMFTFCSCGKEAVISPVKPAPRVYSMELAGMTDYEYPYVVDFDNGEGINAVLKNYYTQITDALIRANKYEDLKARMEYSFLNDNKIFTIKSAVVSPKGRIELPDMVFEDKETVSPPALPNLESFSDGEYLNAYMVLNSLGIPADLERYTDKISCDEFAELNIAAYEHFTGKAVDITGVLPGSDAPDVYKKARVLDLVTFDEDYFYASDTKLFYSEVLSALSSLFSKLQYNAFQKYEDSVTKLELSETIDLYFDIQSILIDNEKYSGVKDKASIIKASEKIAVSSKLNRKSTAQIFTEIYESMFGKIEKKEYRNTTFDDTGNLGCRKAAAAGMLSSMPCYNYFSPDYPLIINDVYSTADNFTSSIIRQQAKQFGEDEKKLYDITLSYRSAVKITAKWSEYFSLKTKPQDSVKEVNNTRPYDWYVTQNDGTEYASVNCMPSISSMAIKWVYKDSKVTPDKLRKKFLPQLQDGWWIEQVEECLTDYSVSWKLVPYKKESIIEALDKGHIVLSQMSENDPAVSGHCFVIYGYKKFGDSVLFLVNDSDVYDGKNIYNTPPGKDMQISSTYCELIITRFTSDILIVDGKA